MPDSHMSNSVSPDFSRLDIERDRDQFTRELLRELSGTLQDLVGVEQASGFISIIGKRIGHLMNEEYRALLKKNKLNTPECAEALVDLKRRIKGTFRVESIDGDRIVLVNGECPFGKYVKGRPSLCMMTSNVFGTINAENSGYARVTLNEAIARGDRGCRVTVDLTPTDEELGPHTREYFATT